MWSCTTVLLTRSIQTPQKGHVSLVPSTLYVLAHSIGLPLVCLSPAGEAHGNSTIMELVGITDCGTFLSVGRWMVTGRDAEDEPWVYLSSFSKTHFYPKCLLEVQGLCYSHCTSRLPPELLNCLWWQRLFPTNQDLDLLSYKIVLKP